MEVIARLAAAVTIGAVLGGVWARWRKRALGPVECCSAALAVLVAGQCITSLLVPVGTGFVLWIAIVMSAGALEDVSVDRSDSGPADVRPTRMF